jgi:hypothetical protein
MKHLKKFNESVEPTEIYHVSLLKRRQQLIGDMVNLFI